MEEHDAVAGGRFDVKRDFSREMDAKKTQKIGLSFTLLRVRQFALLLNVLHGGEHLFGVCTYANIFGEVGPAHDAVGVHEKLRRS